METVRPGQLRFAEEDVYGDIANPFELIEQTALARGIALRYGTKVSQVTLIQVDHHLRVLAQHRRSPFIVAGVTAFVQRLDALLPSGRRHAFRRRPATLEENACGLRCNVMADARTEEQCADQEAEQRGRLIPLRVNPQIFWKGPAIQLQQNRNQWGRTHGLSIHEAYLSGNPREVANLGR